MSWLYDLMFLFLLLLNDQVMTAKISEYKCQEYTEQLIQVTWGAPLLINLEVVAFDPSNCTDIEFSNATGAEAGRGEFPHQALLGYSCNRKDEYEFRCGGSLISEKFILTAAHCGTPQVVRLGEHRLSEEEDEEDFAVAAFYKHPNYTLNASYDDIALVQLVSDVVFSNLVRPACLWTNAIFNLSSVIVTGFGHTAYAGPGSDVLLKLQLVLMPKESCQSKFKFYRKFKLGIQDGQLCIGSQYGGEDTCQGDSGGPVQVLMDSKTCIYHIVGVTSTGAGCGVGKAESIYTQVATYLDWIEDTVWPGQKELYEDDYND